MKAQNHGHFWCFLKIYMKKKGICLYRSNNACTLIQFLSLNRYNQKNNEERLEGLKITPKLCCLTLMISSLATIYLSGLRKEFKLSANIKYAVPLHDTCIPVVIFLRLM